MDKTTGLPHWLAHPLQICNNFDNLHATEQDKELFDALGIEGLFPFQEQVRERLRLKHPEGWRDLCVSAPTGSGKTLAYVLPIVEHLRRRVFGRLSAIVVVPTRDLIGQVEDTFRAVIEAYKCDNNLFLGVDFLVTTPGKLIEKLPELGGLEAMQFLVVDEADRLLDQSFQEWLPQLLNSIKPGSTINELFDSDAWFNNCGVRKLLFSATLTTNPAKIAPLNLYRPLYMSVRSNDSTSSESSLLVTPETLKESVVVFGGAEELKPAVLLEVLERILSTRILCFTKSVSSAQRLSKLLNLMRPDIKTAAFHGNLSDSDRSRILTEFDTDKIQVLVGSDAMARGLDLKCVRGVINYDVPMFAATYVHRVGRTARAGQPGLAITILPSSQMRHFKQMLKTSLNKSIIQDDNGNDKEEGEKVSGSFEQAINHNQVIKVEINEAEIITKWRPILIESLAKLK